MTDKEFFVKIICAQVAIESFKRIRNVNFRKESTVKSRVSYQKGGILARPELETREIMKIETENESIAIDITHLRRAEIVSKLLGTLEALGYEKAA